MDDLDIEWDEDLEPKTVQEKYVLPPFQEDPYYEIARDNFLSTVNEKEFDE